MCSPQTVARWSEDAPSRPQRRLETFLSIDDLVILSILQFSNLHLDSSSLEVQQPDALYAFLQMPATAGGVSGTLGFPRVSPILVTMLISVMGVNRTLLRSLVREMALVLAFRREVLASLDVSYTAATSLAVRRP